MNSLRQDTFMDGYKGLFIILDHSLNPSEIQYKKMTYHFKDTDNELNVSDEVEFD